MYTHVCEDGCMSSAGVCTPSSSVCRCRHRQRAQRMKASLGPGGRGSSLSSASATGVVPLHSCSKINALIVTATMATTRIATLMADGPSSLVASGGAEGALIL